MTENGKPSSFFRPKFYHHHDVIGMVIALHRYETINAQQEALGLSVRYGPPAVNERIKTEDVYIQAATGIYVPEVYFCPTDKTPSLELEDALAQLYKVRGIERGDAGGKKVKTSAERSCK